MAIHSWENVYIAVNDNFCFIILFLFKTKSPKSEQNYNFFLTHIVLNLYHVLLLEDVEL